MGIEKRLARSILSVWRVKDYPDQTGTPYHGCRFCEAYSVVSKKNFVHSKTCIVHDAKKVIGNG